MRRILLPSVLLASACQSGPPAGTFVGNPSMSARLADNAAQRPVGGVFEALEVHFRDCDAAFEPLGATTFTFDGPEALEVVAVPVGERCGLFFVVDWFEVRFDEGERHTTVMADDFDLLIPAAFVVMARDHVVLRFGDDAWLANVASFLPNGGEVLLDGSNPALEEAFYGGLILGSSVQNTRLD